MATYGQLSMLECSVQPFCPLYMGDSVFGPFFIFVDYWPITLSLILYCIGLYHLELYFLILGFALDVDWVTNLILRNYMLKIPSRFPNCGSEFEYPSYASQHAAVLETLLLLMAVTWRHRISTSKAFSIMGFSILLLLARVYLGINTREELIIGNVIGASLGIALHAIMYALMPRIPPKILERFSIDNKLCQN